VEALKYYQRVAEHYDLDIRTFERVEEILRQDGSFRIRTHNDNEYHSRNVVIATGYFDHPNRLGVPGEELPKVFHYYNEPFAFFRKDVAIVGGRNSAVEAALDLYRHGARVTLIHRGAELSKGVKYWILPDIENRIKNGEIQAFFNTTVREIRERSLLLQTLHGVLELQNDFTFVLIGFHPDTEHLRRYGIEINPETLAPVHDERTFETNVPGLFVCGSLVAGKNNNKVFVENGRLHGAAIVAAILQRR
jgi:thioredoxin reductase (NADPH)